MNGRGQTPSLRRWTNSFGSDSRAARVYSTFYGGEGDWHDQSPLQGASAPHVNASGMEARRAKTLKEAWFTTARSDALSIPHLVGTEKEDTSDPTSHLDSTITNSV